MESGVVGIKRENMIIGAINRLMKHKYGDVFLLCSVAAAFGTLLIISALG